MSIDAIQLLKRRIISLHELYDRLGDVVLAIIRAMSALLARPNLVLVWPPRGGFVIMESIAVRVLDLVHMIRRRPRCGK